MKFRPNDVVKSCRKLESGLRLGQEGIHACQLGPFCAPIWWTGSQAANLKITKDMIAEKREKLFYMLNDNVSDIPCKQCSMVFEKPFKDVKFTNLGHVDVAADTICNLRCTYCGYAVHNTFSKAEYDPLSILREFTPADVEWDSAVDFNGGEPTLLKNIDEYIEYFNDRRIRIFLYTNAVIFRQAVYDGLVDGSIRWVITSLDAGSPSSFLNLKKRDKFFDVLQTLTRYAHAGSKGGGKLAVKYIFCEDNSSDDDIAGFAYAMLAIRPQKVWLTFDFEPLQSLAGDLGNLGNYDYSKHINAYARMYVLMKKHGLESGHFTENHLAAVSRNGRILMERVKTKITELMAKEEMNAPEMKLGDFREREPLKTVGAATFTTQPLRIKRNGSGSESLSLEGKRVLLAPTCHMSADLLNDKDIQQGNIIGFLDRDSVLQGKNICGYEVFAYDRIQILNPDMVLIASPEQHHRSIVATANKYLSDIHRIIVLDKSV